MITNLTGTCPYATMCGWCSKWDKECDRKIGAATPTKISTNQFDGNNARNSVYDPRTGGFADIVVTETAKASAPQTCDTCDCKPTATTAVESYINTTTPLTSKLD